MTAMQTESVLTKKQKRKFGPKQITYYGEACRIIAVVRYDDECGNGHNSFSITGEINSTDSRRDNFVAGGCLHDEISKHFPELAPLVKWHLCSADKPMHYIANTVYHALEHGPTHAWVYFTGQNDPLGVGEGAERLLGYVKADRARVAEGKEGYRVKWDQKTVKIRNLDHARSSSVWPEATDEELTAPGLKERLEARLPQLQADFRAAVESLGFTF